MDGARIHTGNAKTSLVVTVGPALSNVTETISSLLFGKRAMKVTTHAKVNAEVDYKALSLKLQVGHANVGCVGADGWVLGWQSTCQSGTDISVVGATGRESGELHAAGDHAGSAAGEL